MFLSFLSQTDICLRYGIILVVTIFCFNIDVLAGDSSRELLNNLYNDILGTVAGTQTEYDTSTLGQRGTATDSGCENKIPVQSLINGEGDAHLQSEIDKMLKDAQQRHEATIQFMQESK